MKTSLIISTYNWPKALELVLKSVLKQKVLPFEIIIADDGSKNETKELVEKYKKLLNSPLIHVWHKDNGFQKAIILNKAIAISNGEYIIQVDGDCILHPYFIKDHIDKAEYGTYLYGSRVNIKKNYISSLFDKNEIIFNFLSSGIKNRSRAIHNIFLSSKYKKSPNFSKKFRGCNTSFFKRDFLSVNGYDEAFKGWGREDSELALRFHNNGLLSKRLRYAGIVYHIWHKELSKDNLVGNNSIELITIRDKIKWTENGIDKYLIEPIEKIDSTHTCIIIPIYKTNLSSIEKQSLKQCLRVLGKYNIYFVEPHKLDTLSIRMASSIKIEKFEDYFFDDILGYNKLLLSEVFYERFSNYKYMLIYQLDCFVFKDELLSWCNKEYDYIGAPWISSKQTKIKSFLNKFDKPQKKKRAKIFYKVGNGGFSLRRVDKFLNITRFHNNIIEKELKRDLDDFKLMEDVFWSFTASKLDSTFTIPNYEEALKFAMDRKPDIALKINNNILPFGCHGINKPKVINFWKKIIPELNN
jgi:glycosyltransferase involved in cell wall biosynthesis